MSIYTYTNEQFQVIHKNLCEAFDITPLSVDFGTSIIESVPKNSYKGIRHPMYGRTHTEESRKRMSDAQKRTDKHSTRGKARPEFAKRMTGKNNPMYGIPSPYKGLPVEVVVCPHCGKSGGKPAMGRWHFKNCSSK